MHDTRVHVRSREEMGVVARTWLRTLVRASSGATIIALRGDLGAGKTTFVQCAALSLGVKELTSPTFVIQKKYSIQHSDFKTLIHIDAYRLEGGQELHILGFDDLAADPANIIFIEWPERVADIVPTHTISFTWVSENERLVEGL